MGRKRSYPPRDEARADQRRREFLDERCAKRKRKAVSDQRVQSSSEGDLSEMNSTIKTSAGEKLARVPPPRGRGDEDTRGPTAQEGEPLPLHHESKAEAECLRGESDTHTWAAGFKPRSAHEHVRNCSQVDRGVKQHIVWTLSRTLLETENWLPLESDCTTAECSGGASPEGACGMEAQRRRWNRGGQVTNISY